MTIGKCFPLMSFVGFVFLVLGTILYFQPGWGLMDDVSNRTIAGNFWTGLESFGSLISDDIGRGRFRPLYILWIVSVYMISNPVLIYGLIAVLLLAILLVWGQIVDGLFQHDDPVQTAVAKYCFPLSFFVFTPFWNIFMYISLQEKFIYVFSALSIYFLIKAYERQSIQSFGAAFVFLIVGVAGKETALALLGSYVFYALLDLVVFKKNAFMSKKLLLGSGVFGCSYVIFIRSILGDYTEKYKDNSHVSGYIDSLLAAPMIVKLLLILAVLTLCIFIVLKMLGKAKTVNDQFVIVPGFIIAYFFILLPWGVVSYLMAPLAPFIMIMFYPIFRFGCRLHKMIKVVFVGGVVVLAYLIFGFVDMPRIEKMANIKKAVEAIQQVDQLRSNSRFFYPPGYIESAGTMKHYTQTDMIYVEDGTLDVTMITDEGPNYLIFEDQSRSIQLEDVRVGDQVYENSTWMVFEVLFEYDFRGRHQVEFSENFFEKMKTQFRQL